VTGICGICKQSLEGDALTLCTRCGARYHPDCWQYNGKRCAIYACSPLRGFARVRRGRGLSRADTIVAALAVAAVIFLTLWWFQKVP
jgi:hypothetical protein